MFFRISVCPQHRYTVFPLKLNIVTLTFRRQRVICVCQYHQLRTLGFFQFQWSIHCHVLTLEPEMYCIQPNHPALMLFKRCAQVRGSALDRRPQVIYSANKNIYLRGFQLIRNTPLCSFRLRYAHGLLLPNEIGGTRQLLLSCLSYETPIRL